MSKSARQYCVWVTVAACLSGCSAVMSYDDVFTAAKAVEISDGINRDEAVLIAQRHVILTGLDQDVSVWHVAEARFRDNDNTWLVFFRTGLDNKVGDRRDEKVEEVTVAVNAQTGSSARIVTQENNKAVGTMK